MRVKRPAADLAALGDDDTLGHATFGHRDLSGDGMRLVLKREHARLAHPHAGEQDLRVAANELRPSGDVRIDPFEAAIVERHDVIFHRLDQPKALQLGELLRILGGKVLAPASSHRGRKAPRSRIEGRRLIGLPRRAMLRHGRPTLVVDAAIAEHLEVLHVVRVRRLRIRKAGRHADAFERRLRDAVDDGRLGQSGNFEDRLGHVDDVMELAADLTLAFHAVRPVHDRPVARAAPVRGDLLGPLIRRAERVRPADGVVVIGLGRAEIVDLAKQEFGRLDPRHAVERRHLVEAAVDRALRRGAVVADDEVDQGVVEDSEVFERVDQPADVMVDLLEEIQRRSPSDGRAPASD